MDAGAVVRRPVVAVERVVGGQHEVAVLEEVVAEAGVEWIKKRRPVAVPGEAGIGTIGRDSDLAASPPLRWRRAAKASIRWRGRDVGVGVNLLRVAGQLDWIERWTARGSRPPRA